MKKFILTPILLLLIAAAFAQPGKKPPAKDKPPTQKEINDMMKEMQKEMDDLSPEDKKMMDSMGIKMPDPKRIQKNISGITDAQLKKAYEDENRIVPVKDNERINSISKKGLTATAVKTYLQSVHEQLVKKLQPAVVQSSEKIYTWLKAKTPGATAMGNAGAGLWMMGNPGYGLYVLSKVCVDDPADADNLNNFTACLSMAGGEQLALPVLSYLNKKYPQNSTILNNIGQAWFGLGDMDQATKYLDSTLILCASHPQATLTKSLIEESKGNKAEAIALVKKSIQKNYSREKEDRLRKLGHKLTGKDMDWTFPRKPDPLGLEEFKRPDFPTSVAESIILEPAWKDFKERCSKEIAALKNQLKQAEEIMQKETELKMEQNVSLIKNSLAEGTMLEDLTLVPFYAPKASLKLKELSDGNDGYSIRVLKSATGITEHMITLPPLRKEYEKAIEQITEKELEQTGEGKPNLSFCPQKKDLADKYLASYNTKLEILCNDYLKFTRNKLNEEAYWYQYIQWPEQFEVTKLNLKIGWLTVLRDASFESITVYKCAPPKPPKNSGKLPKFNDIHCDYHSEIKFGVGSIENHCDKMVTKIDVSLKGFGLKGKLNQDFGDNKSTFADQFIGCTVEFGYKDGVGFGKGPLRAEAKIGAFGFVELDRTGFTDGGIKVTADIKLGTNIIKSMDGTQISIDKNGVEIPNLSQGPIKDYSQSIVGAEAKISIMSGFSVEGKGILQGLKK